MRRMNRILVMFSIVLLLAASLTVASVLRPRLSAHAAADPPFPGSGFAGGGFIALDDFGASDATAVSGIFGGDVLSGDLNSNLSYDGITDRGWLGHNLDTPGEVCRGTNQSTGSLWTVVSPLTAIAPPAGALSAGQSTIHKDDGSVHLQMVITAIVWNSQVRMGVDPNGHASVLSRPGVLELSFQLTNVGGGPLHDLTFFAYLRPHPNGSCFDIGGAPSNDLTNIQGVYDTTFYGDATPPFPDSAQFHKDLTFSAPDVTSGGVTYPGSTMSLEAPSSGSPSTWGIGPVGFAPPTPLCSSNPTLVWCQVEQDTLQRERQAGPDKIGGALGWNLPSLNSGHTDEHDVLLALSDTRP